MEFYLGEIKIVAFNYAPRGWALCNGQLLSVTQNSALFSLLGTTYGGNGTTNFALPNLQSRIPLGFAGSAPLGMPAGTPTVSLTVAQLPAHTHQLRANNTPGTVTSPNNSYFADCVAPDLDYSSAGANTVMAPNMLSVQGSSQPAPTVQPYLVLNFVIALTGIYPSRN